MKKYRLWMCIGVLALGMAGCGSKNTGTGGDESQVQESAAPVETPADTADDTVGPEAEPSVEPGDASADGGHNYEEGWTEEMEALKTVVTDLLGDDYFPDSPMYPDMLEGMAGITPDMYEDYFAEMPMISAHVDMLIVIEAKEGQEEAVEDALNAYRDKNINDTMQYPSNRSKIQASKVERIGSYVVFSQLGGDITEAEEQGEEAVILHCQEVNDSVIEAVREAVQ